MTEIVYEFCWLAELFDVETGRSRGVVYAEHCPLADWWSGKKFNSRDEAEEAIKSLPKIDDKSEWRAMQHGFSKET